MAATRTCITPASANTQRCADMLTEIAPAGSWMIPSIGADFGKAMDQIAILKDYAFPTAMLLPMAGPSKPAGVATGLRRLADAFGRPDDRLRPRQ